MDAAIDGALGAFRSKLLQWRGLSSHHHVYKFIGGINLNHSQSWLVYGIVLPTVAYSIFVFFDIFSLIESLFQPLFSRFHPISSQFPTTGLVSWLFTGRLISKRSGHVLSSPHRPGGFPKMGFSPTKSPIFNRSFHHKPSSYQGNPIYGNPKKCPFDHFLSCSMIFDVEPWCPVPGSNLPVMLVTWHLGKEKISNGCCYTLQWKQLVVSKMFCLRPWTLGHSWVTCPNYWQ